MRCKKVLSVIILVADCKMSLIVDFLPFLMRRTKVELQSPRFELGFRTFVTKALTTTVLPVHPTLVSVECYIIAIIECHHSTPPLPVINVSFLCCMISFVVSACICEKVRYLRICLSMRDKASTACCQTDIYRCCAVFRCARWNLSVQCGGRPHTVVGLCSIFF